jgi:hypothetical protein
LVHIALLLLAGAAGVARAAELVGDEYEIKAAVVYKILLFVDWPARADTNRSAPIVVGVLGTDPFGTRLERAFTNKTVGGRALQCRRFPRGAPVPAEPCHVLFVARSEQERLPEILRVLGTSPTLTIGDTDGYGARGVMVNLVNWGQTVRFEVNQPAAARAGLQLSSQFTDLAIRHHGRPPTVKTPLPGGSPTNARATPRPPRP